MLEHTTYHKILRISVVVMSCVLVFQSGLVLPRTAELMTGTQLYMANVVGVYAGVAPTELNQMTADITAQKLALDSREKSLTEREIAVGLHSDSNIMDQTTLTFVLTAIVFILLVLMILNYALDYARMRRLDEIMAVRDKVALS